MIFRPKTSYPSIIIPTTEGIMVSFDGCEWDDYDIDTMIQVPVGVEEVHVDTTYGNEASFLYIDGDSRNVGTDGVVTYVTKEFTISE